MPRRGAPLSIARVGIAIAFVLIWSLLPATALGQGDGLGRAIEAQQRATERLLTIAGVVGSGVALDAGGQPTIRVYTTTAGVRGVPREVEGIAVQRVVTGLIVARACQDTGDPKQRCDRPVPIGVSVGHPEITAGTIGARVRNGSGAVFALSNNHVLANSNDASIGDGTIQPGAYDGGSDPADRIGTLADFEPIKFNYTACNGSTSDPDCNTIDAAIAATTTSNLGVSTLPIANSYGTPGSNPVGPAVGTGVTKCGRTTNCTTGTIAEVSVAINVCYKPQGPFFCASDGIARFVDQIAISDGSFSAGGDSGSLVVRSSDKSPVGLLFAGSSTRTFANEIGYVLTRFDISIDTDTTAAPGDTTPPTAPTGLTASAGDGQVSLDWANNSESDLAGYNVYRSTTSGAGYGKINGALVSASAFTDTGVTNGTTYYYVVTAVDTSGNQSGDSNEASATPQAAAAPTGLTAEVRRQGQTYRVDLRWTGGAASVDILRQSPSSTMTSIATVTNSGSYTDNLGRRPASGTYSYRVCNAGTSSCSNDASVTLP